MSTTAVPIDCLSTRRARLWLVPSLSDCLFLAILLWVFAAGSGWSVLLADGDTGWHIRTGEHILNTRSIPTRDLFSFSKAGQPWFSWEWLADVVLALLNRFWGLKGVVALSGLVLSLASTLLFRHMIWRGANVLAALAATLVASGAMTVHYLARPHVFTFLGLTVALWTLDRDRRRPGRAVWWLVPLTAVWTNIHGGFLAWLASLFLVAAGSAWRAALLPRDDRWREPRRYFLLAVLCSLSTLANPFGWRLHEHIFRYLTSDWIRSVVDEFQSPRFRSESMAQFEILLFAGIALVPLFLRTRRFAEALLVAAWAHLALVSARHVPIYAIASAPLCASEASRLWSRWSEGLSPRSIGGALRDAVRDFSRAPARSSVWVPVALLLLSVLPWAGPRDFPSNKFPVGAVAKNAALLDGTGSGRLANPRILTTDQWGDYLIYRFYPRVRVFVDGRSDFYGPEVGREYLDLMNAAPDWESIMSRRQFDLALLPAEWPLAQLLMRHPDWQVRFMDRQAILLERWPRSRLNQTAIPAEREQQR